MLITCDIPIFAGFAALQRDTKYRQEYNIQITETSRKGDGIARIRGFVIFVKNAQIGQDVKAKVTSVVERFATAEIVV
jgi:predicted RNA-binding protein with TRAM domain